MAQTSSTRGAVPRRDLFLRTRLHIPPPRPNLVTLLRTTARLDEGLRAACKLTVISAPVGFGTTTLLFGPDAAIGGTRRNEEVGP